MTDLSEMSLRLMQDGSAALTLDEASWLIAEAKAVPELRADRDEGWRQHNKAVLALAGLMSEFRVVEREFSRMKREHEPPYVTYASYAMPEAIRVAKEASKRPELREEPGSPEDFEVTEKLRAADEAASISHDFIHGLNGVTKEQASEAIWTIHNTLRPLFEGTDLGY